MVTMLDEGAGQCARLGYPANCCSDDSIKLCVDDVWLIAGESDLKPADFVASSAVVTG